MTVNLAAKGASGAAILEIHKLKIVYHAKKPVIAVDGFDMNATRGGISVLLGPSGCGKSSVLAAIAGLVRPECGTIRVNGTEVTSPSRRCALMFQSYALFAWKTARDNVEIAMDAGLKRARRERAQSLLDRVGLSARAAAYPEELSGGERQRVAFARALAQEPILLLLDEPFASLDAHTQFDLRLFLNAQVERPEQQSVVLVTHDIEEALFLGDDIFLMSGRPGRVVEHLAVPFPRPRRYDVTMSHDFVLHKHWLLQKLQAATVSDGPPDSL